MNDPQSPSNSQELAPPRLDLGLVIVADRCQHDVRISIDAAGFGGDLAELLRTFGIHIEDDHHLVICRTGEKILTHRAVADFGLLHGDRLEVVPTDGSDQAETATPANAVLRFDSGGLSDQRLATTDSVVLGRSRNSSVFQIRDPRVSKHHARLHLTPSGPELTDLNSKNGTYVNDVKISRPANLVPGDRIRLGRVEASVDVSGMPERCVDGLHVEQKNCVLHFDRAPRMFDAELASELKMPDAPATPGKRKFPLAASLLPLIMGATMAFLFSPIYAMFAIMSPAMAVFTFVDDRRSGRKQFREATKEFRLNVKILVKSANVLNDRLASLARSQVPPVTVLRWWARTLASSTWLRNPTDEDFLVVAPAETERETLVQVTKTKTGDRELRAEAEEKISQLRPVERVPVSINLNEHSLVGICGPLRTCAEIARAMVVQLAAMVSPKYLQLVVIAPDHLHEWEWAKWLPHVETDDFCAIAGDHADAAQLVEWLETLIDERKETNTNFNKTAAHLPHVVVLLHGPLHVPAATLSRIMNDAGTYGLCVITVGEHLHDLSDQTNVVVEVFDTPKKRRHGDTEPRVLCDVTFAASGEKHLDAVARRLPVDEAVMFATDLAPLHDITAGSASANIARSVSANDLLSIDELGPATVETKWGDWRGDLRAVLGMKAGGPFTLDLRNDGPHALVAGTTGSGKSEFLLSLISSMALASPPDRLNFVLIDYKGGAAFSECVELPHTVGYVTNLDDHLAERALISLKAEVTRREKLLRSAQMKDLMSLEDNNLDDAFPSLVLIVDEFALLKAEIPDFVNGLVDIAQRGRSLGVHLILATQKPSGVVTPQIEANTNIRVVQRVASRSESSEVLGSDIAAKISKSTPGRCIVKVGANAEGMTEVQSTYVGGHSLGGEVGPDSIVRFKPQLTPHKAKTSASSVAANPATETDLQRIVAAANNAWNSKARKVLHRPWLRELPSLLQLDELEYGSPNPLAMPIGLRDLPEQQTQKTFHLNLEQAGNVAIYGAPGSGKTTLLRTLVVSSLNSVQSPETGGFDTVFYGLDFANGGLSSLASLPNVLEMVDGSDANRVSLMIRWLERTVEARHSDMSQASVGTWSEWRRHDSDAPPAMIVLIDGFGQLWSGLEDFGSHVIVNSFLRLMADSRSAGVHFVVSANRRSALPTSVGSTIGQTLVQQMVSDEDYSYLNVVGSAPPNMVPGRTLLPGEGEFQCAVVSDAKQANNQEQVATLARLAIEESNSDSRNVCDSLLVPKLTDEVEASELPAPKNLNSVPIGISEFGENVCLNLETSPWVLIVGPNGSGRSNAVELLGHQLRGLIRERVAVATRRGSALSKSTVFTQMVTTEPAKSFKSLVELVETRCKSGWSEQILLCIDDADDFLEDETADTLTVLVQRSAEAGLVVVAAANGFLASNSYARWVRMIRNLGSGIVLQPNSTEDTDVFGAPFLHMRPAAPLAGRGVLVARRQTEVVQLAGIYPPSVQAKNRTDLPETN